MSAKTALAVGVRFTEEAHEPTDAEKIVAIEMPIVDGTTMWYPVTAIVKFIDDGNRVFVKGYPDTELLVLREPGKKAFLRSIANNRLNDNLSALPKG